MDNKLFKDFDFFCLFFYDSIYRQMGIFCVPSEVKLLKVWIMDKISGKNLGLIVDTESSQCSKEHISFSTLTRSVIEALNHVVMYTFNTNQHIK